MASLVDDERAIAGPKTYADEVMERGIRLVFESGRPIGMSRAFWASRRPRDERGAPRRSAGRGGRTTSCDLRMKILKSASVFLRRSSTQTDRRDPMHRRAPGALRGRADLPDLGRSASAHYQQRTGKRSARPFSRRLRETARGQPSGVAAHRRPRVLVRRVTRLTPGRSTALRRLSRAPWTARMRTVRTVASERLLAYPSVDATDDRAAIRT